MPRRKVTHAEFWEAYHFLTDPIKPKTKLAPYWSDEEIDMLCEIQRRLRELMDERDTFKPTPLDDTPYNLLDFVESSKRKKRAKRVKVEAVESVESTEDLKWVM